MGSQARSIVRMKDNYDKMTQLSDHSLMLLSGSVGECSHFGDFVQANLKLNEMRNGYAASTTGAANYIREKLAQSLRSRSPYQVNLLVAGFDEDAGPQLYYIDHLSAMAKVPFAAHGHGSYFTFATMDAHYKPDMTLDEAQDLLRKCIAELRTRFLINMPNFKVRVVSKDGVQELEN